MDSEEIISVRYVPGIGQRRPVVTFIGEAPGREEDLLGVPFVGRSGEVLDRWIHFLGLVRGDVYITNVVKVRPYKNRTPNDEEIKSWLPVLHAEMNDICSGFKVTLGRTAEKAVALLGYSDVVTLYHPAYILRVPKAEETVYRRLTKLKERLKT